MHSLKKICSLTLIWVCIFTASAFAGDDNDAARAINNRQTREDNDMKIRLIIGDSELIATMADNETSRDFLSLLPLTLTLKDYNRTEKVSNLPKRLSTQDAPSGFDPSVGDITYYSPWGNLAIFYRDFGYATGLVNLGHIESGIEKLASMEGDISVRIEPFDTTQHIGDVDGDKTITLADAISALKVLCGISSQSVNIASDVNTDGKIGLEETVYILRAVSNENLAWDKTFPKSDKVIHEKVSFHNRYGITVAANM